MIFNSNLHDVLQEIYLLVTKCHLSAEYIESISPAERKMYKLYFKEEEKAKQKPQENVPTIGSPIDPSAAS